MDSKKLRAFNLAEQRFRGDYAELLAYFPADELDQSLIAFIELNLSSELVSLTIYDGIKMRKLLEQTLASLIDNGALVPVAELSVEAKAELTTLRHNTGIGIEALPPDQPKPPSAEQLLELEVRNDFATLSGDKMREKRRRNKAYEQMYQRIASTLDSRITTVIDCGTF
jgi:hypothetical protein